MALQVVVGENPVTWFELKTRMLGDKFPTFEQFTQRMASQENGVFIWTELTDSFDFDHLEEFCDSLSGPYRMLARLRYSRYDFRTEVTLMGLKFVIADEIELTHFAIANWVGDPDETVSYRKAA